MLEKLNAIPDGTPFLMLNALWYKPDGGEALYRKYMAATAPLLEKAGGKAESIAIPLPAVIGDFDADFVFFVRWPHKAAFLGMITSADYQAIAHLRTDAITKSLLVPCMPL